jgi:hypothetical protein
MSALEMKIFAQYPYRWRLPNEPVVGRFAQYPYRWRLPNEPVVGRFAQYPYRWRLPNEPVVGRAHAFRRALGARELRPHPTLNTHCAA